MLNIVLHCTEVSAQKLDTTDYSDIVYPRDGEEDSDIAQINIPATHLSDREASGQCGPL